MLEFRWIRTTLLDLRYSATTLVRQRTFTTMVVLTVGLGIGINIAIFTLLDRLYFYPLPVKDPDRMVRLRLGHDPSFTTYLYLRDHTNVFSGLTASLVQMELTLGAPSTSDKLQPVTAKFVSNNFFSVLGVRPLLGRTFSDGEGVIMGKDPIVIISHHFWQKHFRADTNVLGRTIWLNGISFVIIGVTTHEFVGFGLEKGPVPPDVWLPITMISEMQPRDVKNIDYFGPDSDNWLRLSLNGRLKPEITQEEVITETELLLTQLARTRPERALRIKAQVRPLVLTGVLTPETWGVVIFAVAAAIIILLIACANIANLLLARSAARKKEFGLRLCLGAGPFRLIQQTLAESLLLASLSGGVGLLFAWWGLKAFLATAILSSLGWTQEAGHFISILNPDKRVLIYMFVTTLIAGFTFSLAPILRMSRTDLAITLKDEIYSFGNRSSDLRLPNALVILQIALCLALLIGAGQILRGVNRVREDKLGFNTNSVLVARFNLDARHYNPMREFQFRQELRDRLGIIPGVQSVSETVHLPIDNMGTTTLFLQESDGATKDRAIRASVNKITNNYFETIGVPITRGRGFTLAEVRDGAGVVMVTESTARNLWPGQEPVGRTLRLKDKASFPSQVIGVVQDIRNLRTGEIDPVFIYRPLSPRQAGIADDVFGSLLLIRTIGDAKDFKPLGLAGFRSFDPTLAVDLRAMSECLTQKESIIWARVGSRFLTGLGLLALSLSVVGLFGIIYYMVNLRTCEIGLRIALGATRRQVIWLILRQSMHLVSIGIVLGIVAGAAVSQVLASLLFGLSPYDPTAYVLISTLLVVVSLAASYLPARIAASIDPMVALRHK